MDLIVVARRELEREKQLLRHLRSERRFPEGRLRVRQGKKRRVFWWVFPKASGKPMKKLDPNESGDARTIHRLAVKSVVLHERAALERNVKALDDFLAHYESIDCYSLSNIEYAGPEYLLPGSLDVWKWKKDSEEGNYAKSEYLQANLRFSTKRGDMVRSKSEVLIADYLFDHGISYRYECALEVMGKNIYPDFTILHPVTNELIFLEHFGKIDDPKYVQGLLERLDRFTEAGIILGRRLFLTWESPDYPLTPQRIDTVMRQIGLVEG